MSSDNFIFEKCFSMVYGVENGWGVFYIFIGEYLGEGDFLKCCFFDDIVKFDFDIGKWIRFSDNFNIKF